MKRMPNPKMEAHISPIPTTTRQEAAPLRWRVPIEIQYATRIPNVINTAKLSSSTFQNTQQEEERTLVGTTMSRQLVDAERTIARRTSWLHEFEEALSPLDTRNIVRSV